MLNCKICESNSMPWKECKIRTEKHREKNKRNGRKNNREKTNEKKAEENERIAKIVGAGWKEANSFK